MLAATDADVPAQSITFSISGNGVDNSAFEIVSGNQLQFSVAPDFEFLGDADGNNVYEVSVRADDGNGGISEQTIFVTVTDVAESVTITVDNTSDIVDGDFSAGQLSLREAIEITNLNNGNDTILFDSALAGQTILLAGTQLEITDSLTIDASALTSQITIDAQQNSRAILFSGATGDLNLNRLAVQNGLTTGDNVGGLVVLAPTVAAVSISPQTVC